MKRYDTVIVGSGYYAFGYAMTHENTLIVEETQMADRHYAACLRPFDASRVEACGEAAALLESMKAQNIIRDGCVRLAGLEAGLCDFATRFSPRVLLDTVCTGVEKTGEGYRITLFNNEGASEILARRVIDTRVSGGDVLHILVCGDIDNNIQGIDVFDGFLDGEKILSLHLGGVKDINRAKSIACEKLENILLSKGAKILCMGYRMSCAESVAPYTDGQGIDHVDETFFGDPFTAFEKGATRI